MTVYHPPIQDILYMINDIADLQKVNSLPPFAEATAETVSTLVEESAKFFAEVIAPLNPIGDQVGMQLIDSKVVAPSAFVEAYQQYVESGWPALSFPEDEGGFGMPELVSLAIVEMMQTANVAFSMCPLLAPGVARVLRLQADTPLAQRYLPKIASGEWSTAMSLTEPQSGSDLSGLRTKATPEKDYYRISGKKIFISWADHDMSENVLHLVLARLPDAPEGSKGLSLFLVPKYLVNSTGELGDENDFSVVSLEHKLGLRASPTCAVNYGDNEGAIGYLVGKPGDGLSAMFILMNHARIQVGMQGPALVERAYQMAKDYAQDRVQGSLKSDRRTPVAIINHPDVRRMLGLMKAGKDAMKAIAYLAAASLDLGEHCSNEDERAFHNARASLLTPIVKGWNTEFSQELVQLAVQIYGGMGYVEETGVTQFMRDARVTTIYEGTSAIQAMDLVNRKLLGDGGAAFRALVNEMTKVAEQLESSGLAVKPLARPFTESINQLSAAVEIILNRDENLDIEAVAFDFMMLSGYVTGAWQMARSALNADRKIENADANSKFLKDKLSTSIFYCDYILPRAQAHANVVMKGGTALTSLQL